MRKISVLIVFCFIYTIATAQREAHTNPITLGFTEQIHSRILNEDRSLNIYLPKDYNPESATLYPVIYLLDGSTDEDYVHIAGLVQFLTMIDTMPQVILVGIANVDRKRDFTFPTTVGKDKKAYPTTGGSANFMAFIEKELQPYIQKKYKVSDDKTLIGQSLGGLLATEILLKAPQLFNKYLIVSPSLWWDNESLLSVAPELFEKFPAKGLHVFVTIGNEGDQMESDAKRLMEISNSLGKSGRPDMIFDFVILPEENHLTILHNAAYKGLEVLLAKKK